MSGHNEPLKIVRASVPEQTSRGTRDWSEFYTVELHLSRRPTRQEAEVIQSDLDFELNLEAKVSPLADVITIDYTTTEMIEEKRRQIADVVTNGVQRRAAMAQKNREGAERLEAQRKSEHDKRAQAAANIKFDE